MYEYIIQLLRKLFPTFIDKKKYNLINNYKKTKQYFLIVLFLDTKDILFNTLFIY